jgi:hypothetical protein
MSTLEFRPIPGRFAKVMALVAPSALISLLSLMLQAAGGDTTGWSVLFTTLLLAAPALLFLPYGLLLKRNTAVTLTDDDVVLTNWLGRERAIPRDEVDSAAMCSLHSAGSSYLITVISGPEQYPALPLFNTQWADDDGKRLAHAIGVPFRVAAETYALRTLRRSYPTLKLPVAYRHPVIFATIATVGTILYIGVVVNVFMG